MNDGFWVFIVGALLIGSLCYSIGYIAGKETIEKEAVERNYAQYVVKNRNNIDFVWKEPKVEIPK